MFRIHFRPVTNDTEPIGHVRGLYGWLSVAAQATHKMPPLGVYGQLMGVMGSVNRPRIDRLRMCELIHMAPAEWWTSQVSPLTCLSSLEAGALSPKISPCDLPKFMGKA